MDHVGGVGYFRQHNAGLTVIAQASNPEHQAYDGRLAAFRGSRSAFAFAEKFASAFEHYTQHQLEELPVQDVPVPDILVEDQYAFSLGGLELELFSAQADFAAGR